MERLYAVRRLQLLKMKNEMPNVYLQQAIRTACTQRNRLRNIHGSPPAELVFGRAPNALAGLIDELQDSRPDLPAAAQNFIVLRTIAAKTFHEANNDALLSLSLLARQRSDHEPLPLGSGPSFVSMVEPKPVSKSEKFRPYVYWLAHGASFVCVASEYIRPENGWHS